MARLCTYICTCVCRRPDINTQRFGGHVLLNRRALRFLPTASQLWGDERAKFGTAVLLKTGEERRRDTLKAICVYTPRSLVKINDPGSRGEGRRAERSVKCSLPSGVAWRTRKSVLTPADQSLRESCNTQPCRCRCIRRVL